MILLVWGCALLVVGLTPSGNKAVWCCVGRGREGEEGGILGNGGAAGIRERLRRRVYGGCCPGGSTRGWSLLDDRGFAQPDLGGYY